MSYHKEIISRYFFEALQEIGDFSLDECKEITLHMTDWLDDLFEFHQICINPASDNSREIYAVLISFLTHAPNHLAAASKLFLDIPITDIYDVGATREGKSFTSL